MRCEVDNDRNEIAENYKLETDRYEYTKPL